MSAERALAAIDPGASREGEMPPSTADAAPMFPLLSIADLAALPEPPWLIADVLPVGFDILFGPSNVGKSFLALAWALCVASGLPWHGQPTEQAPVVYIAGEGVTGIYRRVQAWMHEHRQPAPEHIRFVAGAANFLIPSDVQRAKATIAAMPEPPRLIVVDTMARAMTGGDENMTRDVGRFIAAFDEIAPADAARLTVHHTGKDGEDERGSTALRGAADYMIALKPHGASVRLECVKAKDSAPFEPWSLHLETVLESCVFRRGTNSTALAPSERHILAEVSAAFGTDYASSAAIREASGTPKSSYYRSLRALTDRGFLEPEAEGRNPRYRLSQQGSAQLVPPSPNRSHETGPACPTGRSLLETVGLGTPDGTATASSASTPDDDGADAELDRIRRKFGEEAL